MSSSGWPFTERPVLVTPVTVPMPIGAPLNSFGTLAFVAPGAYRSRESDMALLRSAAATCEDAHPLRSVG
jgi:hypothetical protein